MILLEAEAAWAGAMEIKRAMDSSGMVHTNQRRHYLRRFAKARKWAEELAGAAAATSEDWTVVSCEAYSNLARALELSEKVRAPTAAPLGPQPTGPPYMLPLLS